MNERLRVQWVKDSILKCKYMQYLDENQSEKMCARGEITSTLERVSCTTMESDAGSDLVDVCKSSLYQ